MYAIRTRRTTIADRTVEQVVAYTREANLSAEERDDFILVDTDALPVAEYREGQAGVLVYDRDRKTVAIEYVDRPPSEDEAMQELLTRLAQLERHEARQRLVADLEESSTIAGLRRALLDYYGGEEAVLEEAQSAELR